LAPAPGQEDAAGDDEQGDRERVHGWLRPLAAGRCRHPIFSPLPARGPASSKKWRPRSKNGRQPATKGRATHSLVVNGLGGGGGRGVHIEKIEPGGLSSLPPGVPHPHPAGAQGGRGGGSGQAQPALRPPLGFVDHSKTRSRLIANSVCSFRRSSQRRQMPLYTSPHGRSLRGKHCNMPLLTRRVMKPHPTDDRRVHQYRNEGLH
jgi:hypothetical protein